MGLLRNLVEPGSIALAFTVGTLINTRRRVREDEHTVHAPLLVRDVSPPPKSRSYYPDNTRFRDNVTSRFLAYFPFLMEIWYWNLTYWVYQLARALSAKLIHGNEAIFDRARDHALSILSMEHAFGYDIELSIQTYVLERMPSLMSILARVYYSHIFVGVVFIIYTYTYLPTPLFQTIRRTIAVDNLIAFIIVTSWRCMPPRLLPKEYGFVDILHKSHTGSAWTENSFQLTIAAMPSLHFGTSLFVAVCLWRFSPHRVVRCLAPLWPTAMLLTILATANHFVTDALVGAVIPAIGWKFNRIVLYLRPLEEWGFWLLRTEKPQPLYMHGEDYRVGSPEPVKTVELLA